MAKGTDTATAMGTGTATPPAAAMGGRRGRRRALLPIFALALVILIIVVATVGKQRPDLVVLIVVDTLRADHLGCYGYESIDTPNIDRLAREGTLYENALAAAPVTLPSVSTILTGAYPVQHGIRDNGPYELSDRWTTLPEIFARAGYTAGAFVSSDVLAKDHNLTQGFEIYDADFSAEFESFDPRMKGIGEDHQGVERRADDTVARALAWATKHDDKDLFLFVHLFDPHIPRDPPPPFHNLYENHPYDGEIAFADQQIGRLLEGLGRIHGPEHVLTVFVADHGEGLQDHEEELHGFLLFEEVVRVPMILHGWHVEPGLRVNELVRTIDLLPSLCALTRCEIPEECSGAPLPGIDYPKAEWSGGHEDRENETHVARSGSDGHGVTVGHEERIAYLETFRPRLSYGWCEQRGLRSDRWKLTCGPAYELYDLHADPQERVELQDRLPAVRDSLARLMDAVALASVARGSFAAAETTLTAEQSARLESLGYLSSSRPADGPPEGRGGIAPSATAGARSDSLAVWLYPPEEQGARSGLASPRSKLGAYNRRVVATSFCQVGTAALRAGEVEKARGQFERAIAEAPEHPDGYLGLAQIHTQAGSPERARAILVRAVDAGVKSAAVYARLAELHRQCGDLPAAQEILAAATEEFPRSGWCWSARALMLLDLGRMQEAAVCAERAIAEEPAFARAHFMQGLIAREMSDVVAARKAWRRYLELEPDSPDTETIRAYLEEN
ncbi:MAG: sulfatase-like hydrolase/transferase [Candidatus Eisenbacteria bacterium]